MKEKTFYLGILKEFKDKCATKYDILSLGIFGSVARGDQHENSDLDVFIELENPDPFILFDIKEELEHLCKCKVDLIRLRDSLRKLLLQKIKQEGIYA